MKYVVQYAYKTEMRFVSIEYYTIFYFFLQIPLDKWKIMIIIKGVDRR